MTNPSLFGDVYLVAYSDWDAHHVVSVWTTSEAAEAEVKRLNEGRRTDSGFHEVEQFPVDRIPE